MDKLDFVSRISKYFYRFIIIVILSCKSKSLWIITFSSTITFDIDYGLWAGILVSLFLNTFRNQRLKLVELGQIKDYEIHFNKKKYLTQDYASYVRVIRPTHSIFFVNSDNFKEQLYELCPIKDFSLPKSICENVIYKKAFYYSVLYFLKVI